MFQDNKIIFRFNGLLGVPVEVGQTIFLLALIFIGFSTSSAAALMSGLILFAMIVVSIYLHELGHAWGCKVQSIPVKRIVIYGGGGYCQHTRSGTRAEQELIVAMGPIVNLALWAFASLGSYYVWQSLSIDFETSTPTPNDIAAIRSTAMVAGYLDMFARINLFLCVLNLIPVQPLDGGKLFHLAMLRVMKPQAAMKLTGGVGLVFAVLWIPALVLMYFTVGWVLFFIPPLRLHWDMWNGAGRT